MSQKKFNVAVWTEISPLLFLELFYRSGIFSRIRKISRINCVVKKMQNMVILVISEHVLLVVGDLPLSPKLELNCSMCTLFFTVGNFFHFDNHGLMVCRFLVVFKTASLKLHPLLPSSEITYSYLLMRFWTRKVRVWNQKLWMWLDFQDICFQSPFWGNLLQLEELHF